MNHSVRVMQAKKPKFCKNCQEEYKPFRFNQKYCSINCEKISNKVEKIKEDLKDHSYWTKKCQETFNEYIRLRDKDLPCISCGTEKKGIVYHAGHFLSVGAYPNMRLNEDNCHKQCGFNCNTSKHGNTAMYAKNLILRIGTERFEKLFEDAKKPLKLSIPELQEKIKYYKGKIKELTASGNVQGQVFDVKGNIEKLTNSIK